jgi:tetratricopeptide (TPR) repeat protein
MSPDELFDYADGLENRGENAQALETWRHLIDIHPTAQALVRLARVAEALGQLEEAESAFRTAIKLDPSFSPSYRGLAMRLIEQGSYVEAEGLLRKCLTYDQDPIAYVFLGAALCSLGRDEEAAGCFRRAVDLDPQYEEAYFNLGSILCETDPDQAELLFKKSIDLDPDYGLAHRDLGWLLRRRNDTSCFPEAEYHLRRAVELRPGDGWTHVYLANLYWIQGDDHAAVTEFRAAIQAAPNDSLPLWSLADFYRVREEWESAAALYEAALKLEPADQVAWMNFAKLEKERGNFAEARAYLEQAIELDPDYEKAKSLLRELIEEELSAKKVQEDPPLA